ncbi:glycosyltransferase [Fibrella sp. USSR17]
MTQPSQNSQLSLNIMKNYNIKAELIAGVVVLYNSKSTVIENINTYINQVVRLYVVDNSATPNEDLIKEISQNSTIIYHLLNGNEGIASALNWAANQALEDGFQVLLTMDDDTKVPKNMVTDMINFWNQYTEPIGILSGVHHTKQDFVLYRKLMYTLTSGNLLNLSAFKEIGPFMNELFIDHVDHEYGFRLNKYGYSVIEIPSIKLEHKLGYSKRVSIGSLTLIKYGTHPPVRLYYFARNGIYLLSKYTYLYPKFVFIYFLEISKRLVKASLLDENRQLRLRMIFRGFRDGIIGRLGKHSQSS